MNKFKQIHPFRPYRLSCIPTETFNVKVPHSNDVKQKSMALSVDQYFSQPHNLRNGFISTSPELYEDPQTASHVMILPEERSLPSDLSDDEIHGMVVSRKLQSPAELFELHRLRPNKDDFVESPADVVNDPGHSDTAVSDTSVSTSD